MTLKAKFNVRMKKVALIPVLLLSFILTCNAQDSSKEEKQKQQEVQYEETVELIESENYEFIGRKANPQKGPQIDLTTRVNFLSIQSGDATANLPYFGRAFSGGYGTGDGGIKFNGPMENYSVKKNDRKHRITVRFKVKGVGDVYNCTLSIAGMNNATLTVTSNKRAIIRYTGFIQELSK